MAVVSSGIAKRCLLRIEGDVWRGVLNRIDFETPWSNAPIQARAEMKVDAILIEGITLDEQLALAVLAGDKVAAMALADRIVNQEGGV